MNGFVTTIAEAVGRQGGWSSWSDLAPVRRYGFADLELDTGRRQVWRAQAPIKLTKLTFNLLAALVQRAPNLVHHDELASLAWGRGRIVTPETIAQRIMVLRRSLGDSAEQPRYIEGRRSEGYRLIPEVTLVGTSQALTQGSLLGLGEIPIADTDVPVPTHRARAQALYLQALTLWSMGNNARSIRTILNSAIGIDPGFAAAYGLLAYLDATAFIDTINAPAADQCMQADLERSARSNAATALTLDPEVGPANAALASLDMHNWRWSDARRGFDCGGDPSWANDLGPWFYCWIGDSSAGIARAKHNLARHPTSWIAHRDLGIVFAYAGDRAKAWRHLERAVEMSPANAVSLAWLAYLAAGEGRQSHARAALRKLESLFEGQLPLVLLGEVASTYARIGDGPRAAALFDQIAAHDARKPIGCGTWAAAHIAVRDARGALMWLERAAEKTRRNQPDSGFLSLMNLRMNFLDDPMLARPEFVRALQHLRGR